MNAVRVTLRRTLSRARRLYSTAAIAATFFSICATRLIFALDGNTNISLASTWTMSIAPILPFLSALLAMEVWSSERASGHIDLMLSAPVRERDFVIGKFLGIWLQTLILILIFHLATMVALTIFAPSFLEDIPFWAFFPGYIGLAIQSATWCAIALAASAATSRAASAAVVSTLLLIALPRGIWGAILKCAARGRTAFGEMPLDAHAFDFSCGLFSCTTFIGYILAAIAALFIATKIIMATRFSGRGMNGKRFSTFITMVLAILCLISTITLIKRVNVTIDLPLIINGRTEFSSNIKTILGETEGEMTITAFLSRSDAKWREVANFLRLLAETSHEQGGANFTIRYVDPQWDLGAAERIVRAGAHANSIVIERSPRIEILDLTNGLNKRSVLATINRISHAPQRRTIYWTSGHGEKAFSDYSLFGMSTIARDLSHNGYRNLALDLATTEHIPSDSALVLIAGAKHDFSRTEISRLETYLQQGGRILALLSNAEAGGITPFLARWGLRPESAVFENVRTLSGTDVITTNLTSHVITASIENAQIIFESPITFAASAVVSDDSGTDRISFSTLALADEKCIAAVAERGNDAGVDLKLRPTRLVTIGDASFVSNGAIEQRANANRDFFLNCVSYLAQGNVPFSSEITAKKFSLDQDARTTFLLVFSLAFPLAFFSVVSLVIWRRRK